MLTPHQHDKIILQVQLYHLQDTQHKEFKFRLIQLRFSSCFESVNQQFQYEDLCLLVHILLELLQAVLWWLSHLSYTYSLWAFKLFLRSDFKVSFQCFQSYLLIKLCPKLYFQAFYLKDTNLFSQYQDLWFQYDTPSRLM